MFLALTDRVAGEWGDLGRGELADEMPCPPADEAVRRQHPVEVRGNVGGSGRRKRGIGAVPPRDRVERRVAEPIATSRVPQQTYVVLSAGVGELSGVASGRTMQRVEWVHDPLASPVPATLWSGVPLARTLCRRLRWYTMRGRVGDASIEPPPPTLADRNSRTLVSIAMGTTRDRLVASLDPSTLCLVVPPVVSQPWPTKSVSSAVRSAKSIAAPFLPLEATTTTTNAPRDLPIAPSVAYTPPRHPPAPSRPPVPSPSRQLDVIRKTTDRRSGSTSLLRIRRGSSPSSTATIHDQHRPSVDGRRHDVQPLSPPLFAALSLELSWNAGRRRRG